MVVGKRFKWGQLMGVAVLAVASVSAQAASSKASESSQGSADASANGQSKASDSSVLNGGSAATGNTSGDDNGGKGKDKDKEKDKDKDKGSSSSSGSGNPAGSAGSAGGSGNSAGNAGGTAGSGAAAGGSTSTTSTTTTTTTTGTLVTSAGTAGGAAAGSSAPGGITYGVDGFSNLAAANAFYGLVSGNDNAGINGLDARLGDGWTLAAKDNLGSGDDVSNRVLGIAFSVDAGAQAGAGRWSLSGGLSTGSVLLDVVAVLKTSTQYGLYYFQNVVFDGAVGGDWLSPTFNNNGARQELSHLSIYVRPGTEQPTTSQPAGGPTNSAGGGVATPRAVPEPGTLALAGVALLALAVIRRKTLRRG